MNCNYSYREYENIKSFRGQNKKIKNQGLLIEFK